MHLAYQYWIDRFSVFFGLPAEGIENLLGTAVVLFFYFICRLILDKYLINRSNLKQYEQNVKEAIFFGLLLVAVGLLLKVWLTGGASFASFFEVPAPVMDKIVYTIYAYLFYLGAKLGAEGFVEIHFRDDEVRIYNARRAIKFFLGGVCFLILVKVWLTTSANLTTYLGLLSAGMAIALQDVIVSLAGWFYLFLVKPFEVSDRVQINEHIGDVIDIKLLQFTILETGNWVGGDQPTGRILHFPNSYVFKNMIANYNTGFQFIFSELPVMVTFESDWKKALKILSGILKRTVGHENNEAREEIKKASRTMRLFFIHLDPKIITTVADSGVVLTMRFLCKIRDRRFLEAKVWQKVLEAFSQSDDIDFAYPTQRHYINNLEGKAQTGGPSVLK